MDRMRLDTITDINSAATVGTAIMVKVRVNPIMTIQSLSAHCNADGKLGGVHNSGASQ